MLGTRFEGRRRGNCALKTERYIRKKRERAPHGIALKEGILETANYSFWLAWGSSLGITRRMGMELILASLVGLTPPVPLYQRYVRARFREVKGIGLQ